MRPLLPLLFLLATVCTHAQYVFKGQVSESFKNRYVYLSLVDDYRKSSRVYLDQIIKKTHADSLGFFSFEGNHLSPKNRIYRIHTDSCSEVEADKKHFLRACAATEELLFIANSNDTLALPLGSQKQAFCEIVSTNPSSSKLLEAALLKENMILDFVESKSEAAISLQFDKWFEKLQKFGLESEEPLVELYCHDFLSDRSSETHPHYLKELTISNYYTNLLLRLVNIHPNAPFTAQYLNELEADRTLAEKVHPKPYNFKWKDWLPLLFILTSIVVFVVYRQKKKRLFSDEVENLSPQEQKIYQAIRKGKTNKEIASELFISLSTVKTHINSIYKKLGVSSRNELH